MKSIIDGKIYDTEKAEGVATWSNGYEPSDFDHRAETLYRTESGAYFLHGVGHANSPYAGHYGNMRGLGEAIIVMDKQEACDWLSGHDPDKAVELFGNLLQEA